MKTKQNCPKIIFYRKIIDFGKLIFEFVRRNEFVIKIFALKYQFLVRQKDYKNVARKCLNVTQSGFFEEIVKTDVLVFEKTNSGNIAANAFLNIESKIIRRT